MLTISSEFTSLGKMARLNKLKQNTKFIRSNRVKLSLGLPQCKNL